MKRIKIFDTTLRDGEQSPGCSMNLSEKIEMEKQLEKLGVDIIEAGFAIASPMDHKSVQAIAAAVEKPTVASLARATRGDIDAAWDAVKEAKHPRIHVFLATSEMVAYAKHYCDDIEFSAEDASRSERTFLAKCYETAIAAGATTLNVPDTVGYSTPQEMYDLIRYLKENVKGIDAVDISVHCVPNTSYIQMRRGDTILEDVAIGSGPLDASFKAINRMLGLENIRLANYSLNAVTDGEDAIGEAVVKLEAPDGEVYTGTGLSTDIIESSIRAYVNGINKMTEAANH